MSRLGLDVIASTGVVTGNGDIYGEGQYTGTPPTADGHEAPLPIYPQPTDLPPDIAESLRQIDRQYRRDTLLFGLGCVVLGIFLGAPL